MSRTHQGTTPPTRTEQPNAADAGTTTMSARQLLRASTWTLTDKAVLVADCVDAMAQMPSGSVDAIVTDPPYGLEFMGKEWDRPWRMGKVSSVGKVDGTPFRRNAGTPTWSAPGNPRCRNCGGTKYNRTRPTGCVCDSPDFGNDAAPQMRAFQEWCERWAVEALRVLKPGGHLLAFGGTRTFHRLAVAIEDAGFEVRDCLMWMYGQGFPKSHNVALSIDKAARDAPRGSADPDSPDHGSYTPQATEGKRSDGDPSRGHGASPGQFTRGRAIPVASKHLPNGHYAEQALEANPVPPYEPRTPEAQEWDGWGTALKPAWEPIILARKPLAGSVAENVLTHGTGALNIASCRVGTTDDAYARNCSGDRGHGGSRDANGDGATSFRPGGGSAAEGGRWPANVALAHTESCVRVGTRTVRSNSQGGGRQDSGPSSVYHDGLNNGGAGHGVNGVEAIDDWDCAADCPVALLDKQTGMLASGKMRPTHTTAGVNGRTAFGADAKDGFVTMETYGDRGGASRFFYTAKANVAEREAGLIGALPCISCGKLDTHEHPAPNGKPQPCRRNDHPTVKPIGLMRWLIRLITPPGGLVLDPFTGSGTTGVAAAMERFPFVGIEQDPAHARTAEARIAFWRDQSPDMTADRAFQAGRADAELRETGQASLFGDAA